MKKTKKTIKIIKLFFMTFLLITCIVSIYLYIVLTNSIDIETFVIKKGDFDITKSTYECQFKTKFSDKYKLMLSIYGEIDYETFFNEIKEFNIIIDVTLKEKFDVLRYELKNQDNLRCCRYPHDPIDLCLLTFDSVKDKKYKIKIDFSIDRDYFDDKIKKLIIQRNFDLPGIPFAKFFRDLCLIVFCISLFLVAVIFFCYLQNKKKN